MMRLKTDLLQIIDSATNNKLNELRIEWDNKSCITIVLCAKGYPLDYKKNSEIKNLSSISSNTNNQILKNEIQKLSSKIEKDESNDNGQKIFGINTTIIKPSPIKPTKRKSRQGVVTSWSVFLKDKAIEKQLLENSPKADFGTLSALKSQIWKSYTNEQKNIYKQKASELTKLNKKNKKKS